MYGTPNRFTAMAQAVGRPAAIVAKMILNGKRVPPTGLVKPQRFWTLFRIAWRTVLLQLTV